jgi:homotetrameric cytidine deaminase
MDVPRRNLELRARDPDPVASLAAARALGARDEGVLRQRDTYFAAPRGRLKLREQDPGGAQLIADERADVVAERESRYRLADVPDPEALRAALDAALGITVVVRKRRHLLLSGNVRIHLDDVDGLGAFVELEAVVPDGGATADEAARVRTLRDALGLGDDRLEPRGYAALLRAGPGREKPGADGHGEHGGPDDAHARTALVDAARTAMGRAHAPFSGFAVGAALRDERGVVHAGANVENSAYPQGQCAEASALGVLVAAGGTAVREVAVMADAELITPCGGCRQRLADFATAATPVHLCGPEGIRRTVTLGDLLPLGFGAADPPA